MTALHSPERDVSELLDDYRRTRVVVHRRHRFFREGLADLLSQEPDLEVIGVAATGDAAMELAGDADVVLLDFIDDVVDAMRLAVDLGRRFPLMRTIGMCASD